MSEWQPIETAPRDSTRVLVFCPAKVPPAREIFEAWWAIPFEAAPLDRGWWAYDGDRTMLDASVHGLGATHWMPLPAPPRGRGSHFTVIRPRIAFERNRAHAAAFLGDVVRQVGQSSAADLFKVGAELLNDALNEGQLLACKPRRGVGDLVVAPLRLKARFPAVQDGEFQLSARVGTSDLREQDFSSGFDSGQALLEGINFGHEGRL